MSESRGLPHSSTYPCLLDMGLILQAGDVCPQKEPNFPLGVIPEENQFY